MKSSFTSYKWISSEETRKGRHLVSGDVSRVFNPVGRSECNLISIFGRARQGKSFLMNCLSGESEIFRVSNEKESVRYQIFGKGCLTSIFLVYAGNRYL
jgi:hypothetical protein